MWSSLSSDERRVARLIGFEKDSFNADQLLEIQDLLKTAKDLGIKRLDKMSEVKEIRQFLNEQKAEEDQEKSSLPDSKDPLGLQPSDKERRVAELAGFNPDQLSDSELLLSRDYLNVADQIGLEGIQNSGQLDHVRQSIADSEASTERPPNLVVFIRDQVKPEDLWLPRDWAKENLPTRRWLLDNGLSFENSFTNTAMCSSARATFFTGKFPSQHEVGLLLSDIENPVLDSQIQLGKFSVHVNLQVNSNLA